MWRVGTEFSLYPRDTLTNRVLACGRELRRWWTERAADCERSMRFPGYLESDSMRGCSRRECTSAASSTSAKLPFLLLLLLSLPAGPGGGARAYLSQMSPSKWIGRDLDHSWRTDPLDQAGQDGAWLMPGPFLMPEHDVGPLVLHSPPHNVWERTASPTSHRLGGMALTPSWYAGYGKACLYVQAHGTAPPEEGEGGEAGARSGDVGAGAAKYSDLARWMSGQKSVRGSSSPSAPPSLLALIISRSPYSRHSPRSTFLSPSQHSTLPRPKPPAASRSFLNFLTCWWLVRAAWATRTAPPETARPTAIHQSPQHRIHEVRPEREPRRVPSLRILPFSSSSSRLIPLLFPTHPPSSRRTCSWAFSFNELVLCKQRFGTCDPGGPVPHMSRSARETPALQLPAFLTLSYRGLRSWAHHQTLLLRRNSFSNYDRARALSRLGLQRERSRTPSQGNDEVGGRLGIGICGKS